MRGVVRGKAGEQREATSVSCGFHFRAVKVWKGFKCSSRKTSQRLWKCSSKSTIWGGSNTAKGEQGGVLQEGQKSCLANGRCWP